MGQIPNTECFYCKKPIYKKAFEINAAEHNYCSQKCSAAKRKKRAKCSICDTEIRSRRKTCSRSCANKARKNSKYWRRDKINSSSKRKLAELQDKFDFQCCMIEGCTYNKVYNVHRFVEGRDGGQYEIGNMFAICPNHHAEIHSKIIKVEKVSDSCLRIMGISSIAVGEASLEN